MKKSKKIKKTFFDRSGVELSKTVSTTGCGIKRVGRVIIDITKQSPRLVTITARK